MQLRKYEGIRDFHAINTFLSQTLVPSGFRNWIPGRWEFWVFHPTTDLSDLTPMGIWEDEKGIVGVSHWEERGIVYLDIRPDSRDLIPEMIDYSKKHLVWLQPSGEEILNLMVPEDDIEMAAAAYKAGFRHVIETSDPLYCYPITQDMEVPYLPQGFRIKSLQDEYDIIKVHEVLWKGFNHVGEPHDMNSRLEGLKKWHTSPNFNRDLTVVIEAPDGRYCSFCGLWMDIQNRICFIEPMCTHPEFRQMRLGRIALLEGLRRCKERGAVEAYVGSDQVFYQRIGFTIKRQRHVWKG